MLDPMEYDELIQGLAGDIPAPIEEATPIEEIVNRLKEIDKKQLSEREFFQKVLSVINDINYDDFNEKNFEVIFATLKEIGCVDYKTWKASKLEKGEKISEENIGAGIDNGALSTAEHFITQFFYGYENARFILAKINGVNKEETSMVKRWLKNSQEILDDEKVQGMIDKIIEEAASESLDEEQGTREVEEQEIKEAFAEKQQLTREIEDAKQELNGLKDNQPLNKDVKSSDLDEK